MRIREGDPLEIYTEKDGEVIFKKYSPMGELSDFAAQICESLHKTTDCAAVICDRDSVIASAGGNRRELMDKRISGELEQIMEKRNVYRLERGGGLMPLLDGDDKLNVGVAAPILSEGDVLGCVVFVSPKDDSPLGDVEYKLAQTVAGFLGKQMEG
jgi:AbrB family transcriptional regulator (stage V sporulation protein T)